MAADIYVVVARRVREARAKAGLSLEKLSEAAGISPGFLSYIEANKRKPSVDTLARLAKALDIPVGSLFDESSPAAKKNDADYKLIRQFAFLIRQKPPAYKSAIIDTLKTLSKSLDKSA